MFSVDEIAHYLFKISMYITFAKDFFRTNIGRRSDHEERIKQLLE